MFAKKFMLKLERLKRRKPSRMVKARVTKGFTIPPVHANEQHRFYLSAASIIRNESRHVREWIEFHRLMGFEHFTIYENGSTDGTLEVLAPYVAEGVVDIVPWRHFVNGYHTQALAYAHALSNVGPQTRWLAFFDIDEYMYAPEAESIASVLKEYEDLPALVIYWLMFGTSGHVNPVQGLMIKEFTKRAPIPEGAVNDPTLANYKSVVQPHRIVANSGAHHFFTDDGCNGYDELRRPVHEKQSLRVTVQNLRINHYYTRSLSEWEARFGKKNAANTVNREEFLRAAFEKVEFAPVEDRKIQRFLPELKKVLSSRKF